ncbi:uncharacterized protein LOC116246993 [Nymphaea colorata]|nr:uncharacterized protein LOC116246993 [Nymphaea colorata]
MEACLLSSSSSYSLGNTKSLSRSCSRTYPHIIFVSGIRRSSNRWTRLSVTSSFRPTAVENSTFDVVVVGAGIIGLTVARRFLMTTNLSVAVVDAGVPCSGATGAGQGYIWMTHKTPGSETWDLCNRSKKLWEDLVDELRFHGVDPSQELGWKKTGSLLIGRTPEESEMLASRVKLLSEADLRAEFLSAGSLAAEEPSLQVGRDWSAAFVPDDCQIDAQLAVDFIEKGNRSSGLQGRYKEFFHEPVISLVRSDYGGEVVGVQTSKNILYCEQALVVATGAWSGSLIQDLFKGLNISFSVPVIPRKGYLVILENFQKMQLNHGIMEFGYVDHQIISRSSNLSASGVSECEKLSISMTATTDATGNLLLGSSRQFIGFDNGMDESIVNCILDRAQQFFPALRDLPRQDMLRSRKIRIGFRPYMHDGKPIIGPVPGLPKMILAAGHEGGGLTMALGTAEMVVDMVLNNVPKVDPTPYSLQGRCCS